MPACGHSPLPGFWVVLVVCKVDSLRPEPGAGGPARRAAFRPRNEGGAWKRIDDVCRSHGHRLYGSPLRRGAHAHTDRAGRSSGCALGLEGVVYRMEHRPDRGRTPLGHSLGDSRVRHLPGPSRGADRPVADYRSPLGLGDSASDRRDRFCQLHPAQGPRFGGRGIDRFFWRPGEQHRDGGGARRSSGGSSRAGRGGVSRHAAGDDRHDPT